MDLRIGLDLWCWGCLGLGGLSWRLRELRVALFEGRTCLVEAGQSEVFVCRCCRLVEALGRLVRPRGVMSGTFRVMLGMVMWCRSRVICSGRGMRDSVVILDLLDHVLELLQLLSPRLPSFLVLVGRPSRLVIRCVQSSIADV